MIRDWNKIIGHKQAVSYLKNSLRSPGHALIFAGGDGAGKRTVAECFAKTLQCEAGEDTPCGNCKSCKQADSGNHPDIIYVKRSKTVLSVDDIRTQLISGMDIKPYSSRYKIYIVDEAEKMTEEAQNALLKTFEEPPEYGIIILLTNNEELFLETIRSRAVMLFFREVKTSEIANLLMREKGLKEHEAARLAAVSNGCPGKAMKWVEDEEFGDRLEDNLRFFRTLDRVDAADIIARAGKFAKTKDEIPFFLEIFEIWMRDLLLVKATGNTLGTVMTGEEMFLKKQAENIEFEEIGRALDKKEELKRRLEANVSTAASFEDFALVFDESRRQ